MTEGAALCYYMLAKQKQTFSPCGVYRYGSIVFRIVARKILAQKRLKNGLLVQRQPVIFL